MSATTQAESKSCFAGPVDVAKFAAACPCASSSAAAEPKAEQSSCGCGSAAGIKGMAQHCVGKARVVALAILTLGVAGLAVGYFLGVETTRALWLTAAGIATLLGVGGLVALTLLGRKLRKN